MSRLWVFGYGSLIWDPGFEHEERVIGRVAGYRRAFCMWSIHHRGTRENPGLVLALDPSEAASCEGVAFSVAPGAEDETLAYLRARELISSAYLETGCTVELADGRSVEAVTFIIDRAHEQYIGTLPLEEQAQIIARAHGGRGPNTEYLWNTAAHLAELGIGDADLEWLATRVRALSA